MENKYPPLIPITHQRYQIPDSDPNFEVLVTAFEGKLEPRISTPDDVYFFPGTFNTVEDLILYYWKFVLLERRYAKK